MIALELYMSESVQAAMRQGRVIAYAVPYSAGGGAGEAVTVAIAAPLNAIVNGAAPAMATGLIEFPSNYRVDVELPEDATCFISGKSANGFTVNIQPRLASETLAGGTFNVSISW